MSVEAGENTMAWSEGRCRREPTETGASSRRAHVSGRPARSLGWAQRRVRWPRAVISSSAPGPHPDNGFRRGSL